MRSTQPKWSATIIAFAPALLVSCNAQAQSAPSTSNVLHQLSTDLNSAQREAAGQALTAERLRLAREAAEVRASAQPGWHSPPQTRSTLQFNTNGNDGLSMSIPTPTINGSVAPTGGVAINSPTTLNYTVNLQNGDGNAASNTITEIQ